MQRTKTKGYPTEVIKTIKNITKRDNQTLDVALCQSSASISVSSGDSGPPMSRTTLDIGRRLEFHEGGVEKVKVVCKWWPKWSFFNPRLLCKFIGEGSANLEGNCGIKSLPSL
jgi:hypothetical protein